MREEAVSMARHKAVTSSDDIPRKRRPALTPEGRENQMINLAIDCAERQMREGTASSQVITHYLKLASTREKLEQEKLREENKLLRAKTKAYEEAGDMKVAYEQAIAAMRVYSGHGDEDDYEDL